MAARRAIGVGLFALVFAVYALAAAPGPYFLDSAELQAAAATLGVAHPTGFPLFCLLGKAAALVPLGEIAFRVNLLSAVSAAATVFAVYRIGLAWLGDGIAKLVGSVAGALLVACVLTFFRQATVAEVYAPSALALVSALGLADAIWRRPSARIALLGGLVCGLSLGLHAELRWLVVAPVCVLLVVRALRGQRSAGAALTMLAVAAGVLLYIPVRAAAARQPAANWGHAASARALADHLAAGRIRRAFADQMLVPDRARVMASARKLGILTVGQVGPLAPIFAALGIAALLRRRTLAGTLLLYIGVADAVYAVWVNPMGLEDLQNGVPLIIAIGLFAGAGVSAVAERLGRAAPAAAVAVATCMLVPALLVDTHEKLGNSDGADRMIQTVLAQTPPRGAVLASSDDVNAGLLLARALGVRPDVVALPQQHLWDRALVTQVWEHARAGTPPGKSGGAIIRRLLARGEVLWEDGLDLPPSGTYLAPAGPLPRLATAPSAHAQPVSEILAALLFACRGAVGDQVGARACAALLTGAGNVLYRAGDIPGAAKLLSGAVLFRDDYVPALTNLGVARAALGEPRAAAELEERALALDPENYAAATNAGRYRLDAGDLDAARRHFERARALRPSAGPPLAGLAVCAARTGRFEDARRFIDEALRREPTSAEIRAAQAAVARLSARQ